MSFPNSDPCRYDVVIASDVARTRTNGCIFFKLRDPNVDVLPSHYYSHKFVCVAPYNTDTLLLINIPKTMLEKVIKVRTNLREVDMLETALQIQTLRGQKNLIVLFSRPETCAE